jgi:gamma-glutamylcyclotransferase (GGCT)/AIG2-like uncharacterized protein YtfP
VFVYGTLREHEPLHSILRRGGAEFVGYDFVEQHYEMIDMGPFPAVHASQYDINRIYGEVYAVSDECLAALDLVEGHPNFFERKKIRTDHGDRRVWIYIINTEYARDRYVDVIEDGRWVVTDEEKQHYERYNAEKGGTESTTSAAG